MVSLLNYKAVNEDLQQQQQPTVLQSHTPNSLLAAQLAAAAATVGANNVHGQAAPEASSSAGSHSKLLLVRAKADGRISSKAVGPPQTATEAIQHQVAKPDYRTQSLNSPDAKEPQQRSMSFSSRVFVGLQSAQASKSPSSEISNSETGPTIQTSPPSFDSASQLQQQPENCFTVTWRQLKFCIEPKWHEKLANKSARLASIAQRSNSASTKAIGSSNSLQLESLEQAAGASAKRPARIVLDHLDGSFKSGQLTAILGPSGAGKTTLLDCLTGHRKSGLSGSIRFSSSTMRLTSSNQVCSCNCCSTGKSELRKQKQLPSSLETGDNLKVSIIPQNDHLIGHLSVYETLNYASKMKNCFEKQFDHKLNIERVAQQLGLMSCLGTRINKLSGGQYKRVSIAQELLSSPDILILDEPTSGLDAMTCYQTVQVLRELTEQDKQRHKPIAVILTIHQPNSDVFQQFNHVYVVAQGGKCIYEGPPSNIESVINRIGLHLPNSYYNPATMIVEIAAGKFGQSAITKLNNIQKKQHAQLASSCSMGDEQNSAGDSAVDCPSSSCSFASSASSHDSDDADEAKNNNNNNFCESAYACCGQVNKGFVLEGSQSSDQQQLNSMTTNKMMLMTVPDKVVAERQHCSKSAQESVVPGRANDIGDCDQCGVCAEGEEECVAGFENRSRRKKRRARRRAVAGSTSSLSTTAAARLDHSLCGRKSSIVCVASGGGGGDGGGGGGGEGSASMETRRNEKRLKLNSLKADQKFPFWRHTYLHFHRSWLSIVRDPMLCSMQLALHIIVPVMVSLVYGSRVGQPNACPRAGPVDIMAFALEPTDTAMQLQEDLRTTLENIGYIFFKLYGIIFAAMTVTVLTFPLDMHVLVKEFRNGWYGLSSYFLGRTLADIPFQLTLPLLAMSLSYYATGQPYSHFQWRFFSITAILILSSLIAQSQGLLFGAILMDRMKAAVFVAPAATTPIILFAGFLVRTQSIPHYLRPLSNLSYLRYAIEACLISRYGFNQCECDPAIFNQTVPELPPIARSMLGYWLGSFRPENASLPNSSEDSVDQPDLFTKLIDSLSRANSFGRNITSCEQVVPYPMMDYDLKDSQLAHCFAILLAMLIFTRLLTFVIVCVRVKRKV